jgi:hypothetical protein
MTAGSRAILLALAILGRVAHAEPSAADKAFKEGRELFKAGKFTEACAQFEKSEQLDPQIGTLFNLAQCDEKVGKLASAIEAYRKIVAEDTKNPKRKATAAEYAVKLGLRVPKLVVQVVDPPPGLVITLQGAAGTKPIQGNEPVEVDFGDYTIVARANGFRELTRTAKIGEESKTTTVPATLERDHVDVPVVSHEPMAVNTPPPHDEPPPPPSHGKAIAVLGAGGVALATGLVFGLLTHNKWNDAQAVCGGVTCPTQAKVDEANTLADRAHTFGTISTVLVVGGGVAMAAGIVLWITAPTKEHAVHVTASASASSAGLVVAGWF